MRIGIILSALLFFTWNYSYSQAPETEICLVTVDMTSNYNIIIWDRNDQVSNDPIDSIRIYRKNFLNGYDLIGIVDFDDLSEFNDFVANPNTQSYTYKIQGVDENGVVGPMSDSASTIHLSLSQIGNDEVNLSWTSYEGSAQFSFYQCWDIINLATGAKNNINNTQDMNTLSWNYQNLNQGEVYDILVDTDESSILCESTNRANYNNSRSNRATISVGGGGSSSVQENDIQNINIYPNPTSGNAYLELSSQAWNNIDISIYDISGKLIKELTPFKALGQTKVNLDTESLETGVYTVVIDNGFKHIERLIIN